MSLYWPYANLSKLASLAGGPQELVSTLVRYGKHTGHMEMIPVTVGVAVISFGAGWLIKTKKKKADKEKQKAILAEEELITPLNAVNDCLELQAEWLDPQETCKETLDSGISSDNSNSQNHIRKEGFINEE